MNQKVQIVLECDIELVGEILATVHDLSTWRRKEVVCTAVKNKKRGMA